MIKATHSNTRDPQQTGGYVNDAGQWQIPNGAAPVVFPNRVAEGYNYDHVAFEKVDARLRRAKNQSIGG